MFESERVTKSGTFLYRIQKNTQKSTMKLILAVLATLFCIANANPLPKESIDLVQIPLKNDKVSINVENRKPL